MKKLDKFILQSFFGPFFLTYSIVVFILLCQYILRYFQDLIGKNLGIEVYLELFSYFALNMTPIALPLAMLISSLMTYGNLGEHFELTAIKSSGISLVRIIVPVFIFGIFLTFFSYFFNDKVVPYANLKAYSLLYDIKQKKPTLDFKEGVFYNGLPGYSIKINKEYPDGKTLKDLIIYNHSKGMGNTEVIIADSGIMNLFSNDRFLSLQLFNGTNYSEMSDPNKPNSAEFVRSAFQKSRIIFSLESFKLQRTKEELFSSNKLMRNSAELKHDGDSLKNEEENVRKYLPSTGRSYFMYNFYPGDTTKKYNPSYAYMYRQPDTNAVKRLLEVAINSARNLRSYTASYTERIKGLERDGNSFEVERQRKWTQAVACFVMFLIGAPLGAIIKRGGLGFPVIISISFFIIYYIISVLGEKLAIEGLLSLTEGMWLANGILIPFGLYFMNKARNDSRLLELDGVQLFFENIFNSIRKLFIKKV